MTASKEQTLHTMTSMALVPKAAARSRDKYVELLSTKLCIPASRPTLVARDGLLAKLNNALRRGCQLVLVTAPAGAGKTTLLSSWLRQLSAQPTAASDSAPSRPALGLAWLTLDRDDNQPARFWAYLIGALQTIGASLGLEAQRLLVAPQRSPMRAILSTLLNDLAAYPAPIVLVVDDFELITASAIHKGLVFIAEHAPAQLHVVLSSRGEPPLPLARLRAHDQLAELRGNELAFTIDETAAFLSGMTGTAWRDADVWALHARTEGWIAGLQIAGLELQKLLADAPADCVGRQIALFIESFSGHHQDIRDFLEMEVLKHQPQRLQAFLMQTSILERLSGPLCDAVAEQTGGQELLEQLVKANLFIVPCDGAIAWHRYQRMFAEMLRARLYQDQPGLAALLHRRAAQWYADHGDRDAASQHQQRADILASQLDPHWSVALLPAGGAAIAVGGSAAERLASEHVLAIEDAARLDCAEELPLAEQLTERELAILTLMAEGLSYMQIANQLVIGLNTVRFHVKNMYGKLDVHQRAQAIARAKKLHLLLP
jgi:LuxR family transcriptional regulator, maltose regulon positive regulatory protein